MVQREIGKRVIAIFLIIVGVMLVSFIYTTGFNTYKTSKSFTEEKSVPTIECLGYAYTIRNISYEDKVLSFDIKHASYSGVDSISSLSVIADRIEKMDFVPMVRGVSNHIVVENISIDSEFSVYPDACSSYAVVCDMKSQRCR